MTAELRAVPDAPEFSGEVYGYADRWPMRTPDEIEAMAASLLAYGQRFPITLTPDGVLVDGRNRLRAAEVAGVAPVFEVRPELDSADAIVAFIWDANGDRRDLTKGQKAMLAALRPGAVRSLSEQTGVADGYVAKARTVVQWCAVEVVDAVVNGTLSLNDAYEQAQTIKATEQAADVARRRAEKEAERQRKADAARLADLRTARPDLAALVDAGSISLADALTIRNNELAAERKEAEQRRAWLRKLRDVFADVVTGIDSLTGSGNTADLIEGLAAFPIDPMFRATSIDELRPRVAALAALLDAMEAADR